MRNAFIEKLVKAATKNDRIALVVGDLGYGVVEPFAKQFPKRFFNAGVAEQNMMGLSAGLASEGFQVFVYSIANFPTFRCAEQIRNDVDYHNLPVTIVAVGGGLSYGSLGYSHHAIQDYSLMRSFFNMLIAAPGDPMEVMACMDYLLSNPQPSYLRLGKAGEPSFHDVPPSINPGQWIGVSRREGNKKTFLVTGNLLNFIIKVKNTLKLEDWDINTVPLWSMKSKNTQRIQVEKYDLVVSFEDHLIDGGFGSWVLESLANDIESISKIRINAIDARVCGAVGVQEVLNKYAGLDVVNVEKIIGQLASI